MKTQMIISIFVLGLLSTSCSSSSDSSPPILFPSAQDSDGETSASDVNSDATGEENSSDAVSLDADLPISDTTEGGDGSTADTTTSSDTNVTDTDAEAVEDGSTSTEGGETDDASGLSDAETEFPQDTESDSEESEDSTIEDASAGDTTDEEVEEPGECETDADCLFLTAQVCCPAVNPSPCSTPPEVGTLEDEVAAVAWIQSNCAEVQTCPEPVAPLCGSCVNLFNYAPVCDKTLGECALESEVNCESVCEAISITDECPLISDPDSLDEALVTECGCL